MYADLKTVDSHTLLKQNTDKPKMEIALVLFTFAIGFS